MATVIRAELSEKSKYWIDKHRYYELKHFCMQYSSWKRTYTALDESSLTSAGFERLPSSNIPGDPTAKCVLMKELYLERIKLIERTAKDADEFLYPYLLKAVTEGLSYTYLKTKMEIPCGRDMYYDRYRKFFWLLSEARK